MRPGAAAESRRRTRRRRTHPRRPMRQRRGRRQERPDRVRRHPQAPVAAAAPASTPASQRISPDGKTLLLIGARRGAAESLHLFARRAVARAGRRAAADVDARRQERRAVHARRQGGVLPRAGPHQRRSPSRSRQSRRLAVTRGDGRRLRAREDGRSSSRRGRYLRDNFFDPKFNGVDWEAVRDAVRAADRRRRHARRDAAAAQPDGRRAERVAPRASTRPPAAAPVVGKLGLRFDRSEYEQSGRLRVTDVIPLGPAAVAGIKAGEYPAAGRRRDDRRRASISTQLLSHTINRRVELSSPAMRPAPTPRGCRAAREPGDGEEPALPPMGRRQARLRRQGQRRPARLRAHVRHVRGRAQSAAISISTPRITRARAWSSTCATTTAGSSTCTRSTSSRGRTT